MGYRSLRAAVNDLEQGKQLIRISEEVDPNLEIAAIHRRVFAAGGPALFFERIKDSPFPAVSNLYGTNERVDYLFRKEIPLIKNLATLRNDPGQIMSRWQSLAGIGLQAFNALAKKVSTADVLKYNTPLDQLPGIISWPQDGGAFVTMPQVITEDPDRPGIKHSNIGMYRIQLNGNEYANDEVGLHYQIHRGIGIHHKKYQQLNKPFRVAIAIGGPPAHAMAAILPLPEGMSETIFAGLLNSRRYRYCLHNGYLINADADFVITGIVEPVGLKPEGPFGDHIGYYSLKHPFPFMRVEKVYHKRDPIWHFTVVGRPPAEDSGFGYLIHELFGETVRKEFPGLQQIHAVDAAGVHPLLLAIGSERYMPFREHRPEEIITIALNILGSGQTSLAKYLFITAPLQGHPPDIHNIKEFFAYILERIHFDRDLHFITKTTIDTLDYSGTGLNAGSKLILAAYGEKIRTLATEIAPDLVLPEGFTNARLFAPGILVIQGSKYLYHDQGKATMEQFIHHGNKVYPGIALIVIADDSSFTAINDNNFVWVTFTRSDPASDVYGFNPTQEDKHWSVEAPLIIDARIKPQHAPELIPDPEVEKKIDYLFAAKGPLAKWG